MATRPPKHKLPRVVAPSHSQQVYDNQTRRTGSLLTAATIRNSSLWKRVRLGYIARHPVCENPHGWHDAYPPPAREVHHKQSIQDAPQLAYVHSNLMALCSRCHAKFSQEERR